jgi:predicted N-acetyltransferase YhbS
VISVVRVTAEHEAALAGFYREVWDPTATASSVAMVRRAGAAANRVTPGEPSPTFLVLQNETAIGHVTTTPVQLWAGGAPHPAHWLKGLMVLPEHRNGPVGFLVLREAVRGLGTAMAMVVQPAARRLFVALGFTEYPALTNYLRLLRPARIARQVDITALGMQGLPRWVGRGVALGQRSGLAAIGGALGGVAMSGVAAVRGGPAKAGVSVGSAPEPADVDQLWRRVRGALAATPVRDSSALAPRLSPSAGYLQVTVRCGELVGYAAIRPPRGDGDPRLRGLRVATVSELVVPLGDPGFVLATLAGAERAAAEADADALLCTASHARLGSLLRRRAYLPLPGNVHLLARGAGLALPGALGDWWLTRGDSDADEVF